MNRNLIVTGALVLVAGSLGGCSGVDVEVAPSEQVRLELETGGRSPFNLGKPVRLHVLPLGRFFSRNEIVRSCTPDAYWLGTNENNPLAKNPELKRHVYEYSASNAEAFPYVVRLDESIPDEADGVVIFAHYADRSVTRKIYLDASDFDKSSSWRVEFGPQGLRKYPI